MKIVSFNINGIRARIHQLTAIRDTLDPDFIALQEIKVHDQAFPHDIINSLGYHAYSYGQKGHYGVALLSKNPAVSIKYGFIHETADSQRRLICGEFITPRNQHLILINGYFPQGDSRDHAVKFPHKQSFYAELKSYLSTNFSIELPLLLVGDMNVAPLDQDVGIGAENAKRWLRTGKCGFLPEEREWWHNLTTWGLQDLFRLHHPQVFDRFSWFDYRSHGFEAEPKRGLRIDHILGTAPVASCCHAANIDYTIRAMERPSDHCPLWTEIDI
jgi:exodeoxyribonuclease-3